MIIIKQSALKNSRNLAYARTIITIHTENTGINGTLLPVITQWIAHFNCRVRYVRSINGAIERILRGIRYSPKEHTEARNSTAADFYY